MIKNFAWFSASVLALVIGQSAIADTAPATTTTKSTKPCHCHHDKMMDKLSLTAEQKAQIATLREKARAEDKAHFKQLRTLRHEMHAVVTTDKVDQAKLDALIAKRTQIKATMLKNKMMMSHDIYALLTPQQKAEYKSLEQQWSKKHRH